MPTFKVLTTQHAGEGNAQKAKTFKKGDVIRDPRDLDKMFRGCFERVSEAAPPAVSVQDTQETPETGETTQTTNPLGEDVSSGYEAAQRGGLLVFKAGAKYSVADADAPKVALNEKPLKEKDVAKFLKDYLAS
jgi:hypothetical protein